MFLTRFSYFSRYVLVLVFLRNCYLPILLLQGSTSYMHPQNLGTAHVVLQNKAIFAFLAEGFSCERLLGKCESYHSYSQKLLD
jgi:hypothetical protein